MVKILLLKIGEAKIEMQIGQLGVSFRGQLQFLDGFVVFITIQMGFAHQEMELSRILSNLDEAAEGALFEFGLLRFAGGNTEHVKIIQLVRFLCPQRLQRARSVSVALGEKVAKTEQIARLQGIGRVSHDRLKWRNRLLKLVLPVIDQTDI